MVNAELTRLAEVLTGDDGWALDLSRDISSFQVSNSTTPEKHTFLQSRGVETIPNRQGFSLTVPAGQFAYGANSKDLATRLRSPDLYPFVSVKESYDMGYFGRYVAQAPLNVPTAGLVARALTLQSSSIWYAGTLKKFAMPGGGTAPTAPLLAAGGGSHVDTEIEAVAGEQIYVLGVAADGDKAKTFTVAMYDISNANDTIRNTADTDLQQYAYTNPLASELESDGTLANAPTGDNPGGWSSDFVAPRPGTGGDDKGGMARKARTFRSGRSRASASAAWGNWTAPVLVAENAYTHELGKGQGVSIYPNTTDAGNSVPASTKRYINVELSAYASAQFYVYVFSGTPMRSGN